MAIEEGPRALFYGLAPGLIRQSIFLGLANGLYVPIRNGIIDRSEGGDHRNTKATIP